MQQPSPNEHPCHHVTYPRLRVISILFILLQLTVAVGNAFAQQITASPNVRSAAMDEIVTVTVVVENPNQASTPEPPTSNDYSLTLRGGPSTQESISIINGRRSQTTRYTYQFTLTPRKTGILSIGPFVLKDNGRQLRSKPFRIKVTEASDSKDLICSVEAPRDTLFVGEAVELKLNVWIRIYEQPGLGRFDARYMLNRIQPSTSEFGIFTDTIQKPPALKEEVLKNKEGRTVEYYKYTWTVIHYPSQIGALDVDNIRIEALYPTRLRRTVFDMDHARPPRRLLAKPEPNNIEVKAVPLDGRPPYYRNAIGQFRMQVSAAPRSAAVGDPVTLNLRISGNSPLDGIAAPRLSELKPLVNDFEITDDSLAGVIAGNTKTFSQTIRPRHADVKEIPALPFSYFDPAREQYDTVWSDPIPLAVRPAERINVPSSNEAETPREDEVQLTQTSDGLLANRTDVNAMLVSQRISITTLDRVVIAGFPVLALATMMFFRTRDQGESATRKRRRSRAFNHAEAMIASDKSAENTLRAMLGFVADICDAPTNAITRVEAVDYLHRSGLAEDLVDQFDRHAIDLEALQYASERSEAKEHSGDVVDTLRKIDKAATDR